MDISLKGNTLTLVIRVDPKGTPSVSGRSVVVASTNGFVPIPDTDMKVSVNVIKPLRIKLASA